MADRVPLDPAVLELPERIRVHALAKRLGVTSRQILAELAHLGAEARSPQSNVERSIAQQVVAAVASEPELDLERPASLERQPEPANHSEPETTSALFATAIPQQPPVTEPVVFDSAIATPLFLSPETTVPDAARRRRRVASRTTDTVETSVDTVSEEDSDTESGEGGPRRRRRGRRGRGRGRGGESTGFPADTDDANSADTTDAAANTDRSEDTDTPSVDASEEDSEGGSSRRRRRRRRRKVSGEGAAVDVSTGDDPPNTVVHEREPRTKSRARRGDEVQGIVGSTRLAAKRQRRRDGRDAGRRRPPILTESEFLARREAVDRLMVVREKPIPGHPDATQVAVLEDRILVEHFVTNTGDSGSLVGNVYLGRVQNVLPSMEAAFVDIGRGRNGVLYAGEVDWEAAGLGGRERKIEQALKPGDQVVVQVSKDPVGHKGARLTTQISIAGRFLVYVPGGSSMGISRKLPDTERRRLKEILNEVMPEDAGVIIRTAAEGVSAAELTRDVERLQAAWQSIQTVAAQGVTGPATLYEEPDLLVKVVRDLFNEDFSGLVIEGDRAAETVENYIRTVAPDLLARVSRHEKGTLDVFQVHRIDEQLAKALDRKVWLPSGGTLVIDRTEAMTVIDVNTGKFTGSGNGNLEETVTRNNLEAAEEIVRQMRLRDIGGMIVVDFIDMVLESNQELVLRRLTEALGRDRTRHQVSEVTSLGLVQMTRKRLGTGLLEAFSTACEYCHGRGVVVHHDPIHTGSPEPDEPPARREPTGRRRRGRARVAATTSMPEVVPESVQEDAAAKRAHPVALAMAAHQAEQHGETESPVDAERNGVDNTHGDASQNGVVRNSGFETENSEPKVSELGVPEEPLPAPQDFRPRVAPRRRRAARSVPIAASSEGTAAVFVLSPGEMSNGPAFDAQLPDVPPEPKRRPRRRSGGRPAGPPPAEAD